MSSKLLKLVFLLAIIFLFTLNATSKVTVIIYGKGGVTLSGICPQQDPAKCAEIIFEGQTPQSLTSGAETSIYKVIVKDLDGNLYNATLQGPFNNKENVQGKDVKILKLTPIK